MKWFKFFLVALSFSFAGAAVQAQNQSSVEAPNKLIESLSGELLDLIKHDETLRSGNIDRIIEIVNSKVLPHLNFRLMTAMAVGPKWREATNEQKDKIVDEFQMMLIRTYSGALDQVSQEVKIVMLPYRADPQDKEVMVRTHIYTSANATPVELSYRLRLETTGDWKVFNVNVAGVWMVENYRSQFQSLLSSGGIDGLIKALQDRNIAVSDKKAS
ncbi:MAG: MlaC/ttg2D family ABC transporter substrate-binding protein [Saezia sp.]